jgi:hypothetical protein
MITLKQYFGGKPHTTEHEMLAFVMLSRVENLVAEAVAAGAFESKIDPDTGTEISGSKGGSGDGGFRLPDSKTGKKLSSHKEAKAVDRYDPDDKLDDWISKFDDGKGGNSKLQKYGLYREHPKATPGWCHLTSRAPGSGKRTFIP